MFVSAPPFLWLNKWAWRYQDQKDKQDQSVEGGVKLHKGRPGTKARSHTFTHRVPTPPSPTPTFSSTRGKAGRNYYPLLPTGIGEAIQPNHIIVRTCSATPLWTPPYQRKGWTNSGCPLVDSALWEFNNPCPFWVLSVRWVYISMLQESYRLLTDEHF